MGRAKSKTVADWMKKPWIYDIGTGDDCKMGCKCCKHAEVWKFCTTIKATQKSKFGQIFKPKIWAPLKRPQKI